MEPNNQVQRRRTFLNFLLFFAVTVGMVVVALLFSFRVPFKENEQLRTEMDNSEKEKVFMGAFEIKMQETINQLDTLNMPGNTAFITDKRIDQKIAEMTAMMNDAPASLKGMVTKMIISMRNLQIAKNGLRECNNNTSNGENKDERIRQLEDKLTDCNKQIIDMLKSKSGG